MTAQSKQSIRKMLETLQQVQEEMTRLMDDDPGVAKSRWFRLARDEEWDAYSTLLRAIVFPEE